MHILKFLIRLSYFYRQWKTSVIIINLKPGKAPNIPFSYRTISLLTFFTKLCEKLIRNPISSFINGAKIIKINYRFNHQNFFLIYCIKWLSCFFFCNIVKFKIFHLKSPPLKIKVIIFQLLRRIILIITEKKMFNIE